MRQHAATPKLHHPGFFGSQLEQQAEHVFSGCGSRRGCANGNPRLIGPGTGARAPTGNHLLQRDCPNGSSRSCYCWQPGREASCAPRPPQQFQHFTAPRPLQPGHTLVLGFMGGRDSWRNTEVGVGRTAQWLRQKGDSREYTWRPSRTSSATWPFDWFGPAWTATATAASNPRNVLAARIVLYGQSFGGAAVVKFARQLDRLGVPVLLTIQVDSVGRGDGLIPPNVRAAANLYQDNGRFIRGEAPIRAADPSGTRILGNFRFDYSNLDIDLSHLPWYKTIARRAHAKMDRDPKVWRKVEELLLDAL